MSMGVSRPTLIEWHRNRLPGLRAKKNVLGKWIFDESSIKLLPQNIKRKKNKNAMLEIAISGYNTKKIVIDPCTVKLRVNPNLFIGKYDGIF